METMERPAVNGRATNNPTGKNVVSRGRPSNWGNGPVFKDAKVFTTGQVAKICKVATRTVSKWFDSGRLKGYRIPGSEDRRVPRENLIRFLKEHGMPLGELEEGEQHTVLLIGTEKLLGDRMEELLPETDGFQLVLADTAFAAGLSVSQCRPAAAVIDASLGRSVLLDMARRLRSVDGGDRKLLVALVGEDFQKERELFDAGCDQFFVRPVDPAALAEVIRAGREE